MNNRKGKKEFMITEKGYIMYNYDECIYISKNNID